MNFSDSDSQLRKFVVTLLQLTYVLVVEQLITDKGKHNKKNNNLEKFNLFRCFFQSSTNNNVFTKQSKANFNN